MKNIAAGTYWDLELGYDLDSKKEKEIEASSDEYDLEALEAQQTLGGHRYQIDDEGKILCVEHQDLCEYGIGSGKHIKVNHEPRNSDSHSQNSYMDQEYIEELHSREEQDNTPKYPMYLPQKTIPTDQNSLSAV